MAAPVSSILHVLLLDSVKNDFSMIFGGVLQLQAGRLRAALQEASTGTSTKARSNTRYGLVSSEKATTLLTEIRWDLQQSAQGWQE